MSSSPLMSVRYVDFEDMVQRRYDNPQRKRYVKRQIGEAQEQETKETKETKAKKKEEPVLPSFSQLSVSGTAENWLKAYPTPLFFPLHMYSFFE
jgi:hypothetical protein